MRRSLATVSVLAALMIGGVHTRALTSQSPALPRKPHPREARPAARERDRCWPGTELANPDIAVRRPTPWPILRDIGPEPLERNTILLKSCIGHTGVVARVIVLRSTGSASVDRFYQRALARWVFKPVMVKNTPVRSVSTIAITLDF